MSSGPRYFHSSDFVFSAFILPKLNRLDLFGSPTKQTDNIIQIRVASNLTSGCPYMRRPNPDDMTLFRDVYHILVDPDNSSQHSYFLNTYYDDRLERSEDISVKTVGKTCLYIRKDPSAD